MSKSILTLDREEILARITLLSALKIVPNADGTQSKNAIIIESLKTKYEKLLSKL